jgi:hypothetical protein
MRSTIWKHTKAISALATEPTGCEALPIYGTVNPLKPKKRERKKKNSLRETDYEERDGKAWQEGSYRLQGPSGSIGLLMIFFITTLYTWISPSTSTYPYR